MQHISLKITSKVPGYDLYGAPGVLKGDFGGLYKKKKLYRQKETIRTFVGG